MSSKNDTSHAKVWSDAEKNTLLALKEAKRPWPYILDRLPGRTRQACQDKWHALRHGPSGRAAIASRGHDVSSASRRASRQAQDMRQSAPEPVSLTALLLGDPLPGRSALDRRKQRRSAISLAPVLTGANP